MTPFYGGNERPVGDVVPDWLMGGNRKRRVIAALADHGREGGWSARELIEELRCGRSTTYEILRALRALDVLDEVDDGRLRLDVETDLGEAIAGLLQALTPFADESVDRPPRARSSR